MKTQARLRTWSVVVRIVELLCPMGWTPICAVLRILVLDTPPSCRRFAVMAASRDYCLEPMSAAQSLLLAPVVLPPASRAVPGVATRQPVFGLEAAR